VHGDALALLQPLVRGADRENEPVLPFPPPDRASFRVPPPPAVPAVARDNAHPPDGTYDSGKHSRLSNTNNVSGPIARRSTGIQRGASGSGAPATPGKAGTAPSPSHTGAWTQYSRSTSPSASSLAPRAPPPSHSTEWIPAPRSIRRPSASEAGRNTRTPLRSSSATLPTGASAVAMTQVGMSRAVFTRFAVSFSMAR